MESDYSNISIYFECCLTHHCNLNCACCDHFCPIAEEWYLDIDKFENDLKAIQKLFPNKVDQIRLTGGEPTLHPKVEKFFGITRKYFPEAEILLYTNGLLLKSIKDSFWAECNKNNIKLSITQYPISMDYEELEKLIHSYNVELQWSNGAEQKQMWHFPLDVTGSQNAEESYDECYHGHSCIELYEGRLYPCSIIPHMQEYEKKYLVKMLGNEYSNFGINIHDPAITAEDVVEFLITPPGACKYCNVKCREIVPYAKSTQNKKEW